MRWAREFYVAENFIIFISFYQCDQTGSKFDIFFSYVMG